MYIKREERDFIQGRGNYMLLLKASKRPKNRVAINFKIPQKKKDFLIGEKKIFSMKGNDQPESEKLMK